MEIRTHWQTYRRHLAFMIMVVIVVTATAVVSAVLKPVEYRASIAFAVNRINAQTTTDYQYDGYYAIQAADLLSQTVVSWFLTPSVLLSIYDRADVEPMITSLDRFTSRFKAKKYSSQNIVVSFVERERDWSEKLSAAVILVVEEQAAALNTTAENTPLFRITGSQPVIVEHRANPYLAGLVGFVAGWLLALALVEINKYLRD